MKEVLQFLRNNKIFYIATIDGDQPRVRPFGAVFEMNGRLYLTTNNTKPVYRQIQANPKIEICSFDGNGRWLRLEAAAVHDTNRDARVKALEEVPELNAMYKPDDGIFEVVFLKNAVATFSSFDGAPRVVRF